MQRDRVQKLNTCIKQLNGIECMCRELFSRIDLTCNDMCVCVRACVDLLNVFHGMCVYKCTVHECMYVLCTRFHFITMQVYCTCVCVHCVCVCCVCDEYGVQAIYITMQVCTFMHSMCFVKTVRNKNPKSLQVVQAQSVCVCVCVCVCMLCKNSAHAR